MSLGERRIYLSRKKRADSAPRIIEPLASRCSKFRFRPLGQLSSQARVEMIASAEGVDVEDGVGFPALLIQIHVLMQHPGPTVDSGASKWRSEKSYHVSANRAATSFRYRPSNRCVKDLKYVARPAIML